MSGCQQALVDFLAGSVSQGWRDLAPFRDGAAEHACAAADRDADSGAVIAPAPDRIFAALATTPFAETRVIILGQDPYPTPEHANGLAFSYAGPPPLPRSLTNIQKELRADLGSEPPRAGDLTAWARQGVLLLNTALTVRVGAGKAGSHLGLGWRRVTDGIVAGLSEARPSLVFMLWGGPAQRLAPLIDTRHLIIASAHPSPLSARRGFFGSKPFSRANQWLVAKGERPIAW